MKISTGKGDKGQTGLFGGDRVDKDDARIECLGDIDEFNSTIGLLRSKLNPDHEWQDKLQRVQTEMMEMMSHIATPGAMREKNTGNRPTEGPRFCEMWSFELERGMDEASNWFLLPGGNEISSLCHTVRTQIRRAERRLTTLRKKDPVCVEEYMQRYLNRLSDTFFLLARLEIQNAGIAEEKWRKFKATK